MRLVRRGLVAVSLGVAVPLLLPMPAAAAPAPPPNSIAGMGDSITRAFNACGFYIECLGRSFSTGNDAGTSSHYLRIRNKNAAIAGRSYNVAKVGAKAAAMPAQAERAVAHGVQYVTLQIGANDACTGTESAMTSTGAYRAAIDSALHKLKTGLPAAKVVISSVPDIKRLWAVGKDNVHARDIWGLFGICKSMLANPTSVAAADTARRDRVRQRVVEYNAQLAQACAAYGPDCRFDNNAAFNYPFALGQVSPWDFFHPNGSGQRVLAEISYTAGFNW